MEFLRQLWHTLLQFPEYIPAALAAVTVLALGAPLYLGIWYFLGRRNLAFPWRLRFGCLGSFILFSGLAFIFSSPLQSRIPSIVLNAYLFVACGMAAYTMVPLFDVFFIEYYLVGTRKVYISPPLRKVIDVSVFLLSFFPIMRYMLRFNPFARVAIPTIATAGIALALQDTFKAFFAGIGLGRLLRIGDWISFQDKEGRVTDINWGRTALRTIQGDLLFIPNTLLLTQPFYNYSTHQAHRLTLKVRVAYTISPERVKAAMELCAKDMADILSSPKPLAQVLSFEDASIHYGLFYSVADYGKRYEIHDKLATRVWEAFRKEGFDIPFPFPIKPLAETLPPAQPATRARGAAS